MKGIRQDGLVICPPCGSAFPGLRDGVCTDCWYASRKRPKPVRDRFAKLARLRELGVDPYGHAFDRSHELREAFAAFEGAEAAVEGAGDGGDPPELEERPGRGAHPLLPRPGGERLRAYRRPRRDGCRST